MGNLFSTGGLKSKSNLSEAQRNLLPGLGEFFGGQLGTEIPGISELQASVLSGLGGGEEFAREIFQKGFLDPALNIFDEQIGPRIDTGFAGIGGSLSSRRGTARADALQNILTSAQGDFTRMLPEILGFPAQNALTSAQALGSLESLRFLPANQALGFVGLNTKTVANTQAGPGFDILGDVAGAAAFGLAMASSQRWKSNVVEIKEPLETLARLRGVYYDWDAEHGGKHDIGMIAEEVGEVLPEVVLYEENGTDAIGMDYAKLVPLLVEAVKALSLEVAELRSLVEVV